MTARLRHSRLAAFAAVAIVLGAAPALAHGGPANGSGGAMVHGDGSRAAALLRLDPFGGSGWGHGDRDGWGDNRGHGHGHGHGGGWGHGGRGHGGWGHGHGGDWWHHGGGRPCSPG